MTTTKITVLIPVYNTMPFIMDAVDSILNQTFKDFELLIINDGSKDGTADFLDSLSDSRIRVIHQENRGLLKTLVRGFKEASGEWVARLDADDIALPHRLEKQYDYIIEHPDVAAVFCSYKRIGPSGKTFGAYHLKNEYADDPLLRGYVTNSTMFCNKEAYLSVGGYREVAHPVEDLDLPLRLQEKYKLGVIEEPLIEYRFHPGSNQVKHTITILLMRRYVRFCAMKRWKGLPEPSVVEFLEQDLELPFLKRFVRLIRDQSILYQRLAMVHMLNDQTLRGLYYLSFAAVMNPIYTFRRIATLFTDLIKNIKQQ